MPRLIAAEKHIDFTQYEVETYFADIEPGDIEYQEFEFVKTKQYLIDYVTSYPGLDCTVQLVIDAAIATAIAVSLVHSSLFMKQLSLLLQDLNIHKDNKKVYVSLFNEDDGHYLLIMRTIYINGLIYSIEAVVNKDAEH